MTESNQKQTAQEKPQAAKTETTYARYTYRDADGTTVYVSAQVSQKRETYGGIDI